MEKIKFNIYQLKYDDDKLTRDEFIFMNSLYWRSKDKKVCREDYKLVYSGYIDSDEEESISDLLERLYHKFNYDRPEDYKARSMSVSDVVRLMSNSKDGLWFVDSVGFTKLEESGKNYDFSHES